MKIDRVMAKKVNGYRQTDQPTEKPNNICITRAPMELKTCIPYFKIIYILGYLCIFWGPISRPKDLC